MAAELIHFDQGRVRFDSAVGHIATALSPLGAAASITATLGACAVEISRFRLASDRLRMQRDIASDVIRIRQSEIILLYNAEKARSHDFDIAIQSLSYALRKMVDVACNVRAPKKQIRMAENLIPILTSDLRSQSSSAGDNLIRLSESLRLGSIDAVVSAWHRLEP